jgi:hypothetical protein
MAPQSDPSSAGRPPDEHDLWTTEWTCPRAGRYDGSAVTNVDQVSGIAP